MKRKEIILLLHNLRSVYNVGSIFRTADACGVSKIILSGTTPTPLDRFGRARKDLAKVALGAEKNVSWEKVGSTETILKDLKKEKFQIIAIEQARDSIDYKKIKIGEKTILVFGSETKGLSKSILSLCDKVAEIPMKGKKESLNVSIAAGVALFRILNI
jgi:23S rRNA (guanosine2251-2'-O)-methyltransferase